jgi:hypothetical protein
MKGTLIAEQAPFQLYLIFNSMEFHETPHVKMPVHALKRSQIRCDRSVTKDSLREEQVPSQFISAFI